MRRIPTRLRLAVAAGLAAIPSAAIAAEGMPQLNFGNPLTISQVVWLAIIFAVFYLILSRSALPRVTEVMQSRAARIDSDLETARQSKTRADEAAQEITRSSQRSNAEAQAQISQALAQAKEEAAAQARVAEERLDAQLAEAERSIADARTAAMGALRQVASETASVVVARLTGQHPDSAAVESAVNQVMAARA